MTNLIAIVAVCIVTNVTHWNNEERSPHHSFWIVGEPQPGNIVREMTEKTETIEVVEILKIKIDPEQLRSIGWVGGLIEGEQERVLSRKVRRWIRKDNWIEEERAELKADGIEDYE